ncbi:hypothetical protein ACTL32_02705 [Planococcus sp. FY231025]|uniref:hypothetical protein n=1 Tax=Planococcus sp. FY231025 TaxID=3455699 RepID=UPI003F90E95F
MKKNLFLAAILFSAGAVLAACGTAETSKEDNNSTAGEQTAEETPAAETETPEEPAEETEAPEEPAATKDTEEAEESSEEPAETTTEEPSKAETEGTLTPSDEQPYQIKIVRGYELTSEEPGKDSLFLSEDSGVFMRIETFPKEDISFDQAVAVMKETVQASNPDAEASETAGPEGAAFLNSAAYEVPSTEGKVTGIVFEKEDIIARLTIFDSTEATATEDFIDMAKTIEPKE